MSNGKTGIVAKDKEVFLLLVYTLGQLKSFFLWCYMKIDSNQFIKIKMVYVNFWSKSSNFVPKPHAVTGCDTTSHKFNVKMAHIQGCKNPSNLTFNVHS